MELCRLIVSRAPRELRVERQGIWGKAFGLLELGIFEGSVIDKGFISFAAQKCRRRVEMLEAAKVMKPCSELNGWEA